MKSLNLCGIKYVQVLHEKNSCSALYHFYYSTNRFSNINLLLVMPGIVLGDGNRAVKKVKSSSLLQSIF